jgi:chitodextrinase
LSATANGNSEIDLSWGASTESGGTIVQYVVERCQGAGCSGFAQIGTSGTTTFRDQDTANPLAPSTTYTYRVRAQDALGTSGPYSNLASATTAAAIAPTAPTALAATAAGITQINLSWGAATESGGSIAQYLIERRVGAGRTAFTQIGTSSTLSYGDSGLNGSTSYGYRVRAQDTSGNIGPYSDIATATTATPVLTAPTSLAASPASSSQINLTWGAASETGGTISGYLIERCQGTGCSTFTQVASASGTSFNDTGLTASTAYSYRVRATDAAGDLGPYSNSAGATTAAPPVNPITFVQQNSATPQTTQSTVTVRFPFAQQQGDLNVVVVGFWNDASVTVGTVSDSSGNVYQLAVGPTIYSGTATQAIYYAKNIVASSANTVTVSFNGAAAYPDIRILEYSGLDTNSPLDVTAAATGSGTLASSGAATTTFANELIFGADLTGTHATGAGAGFTSRVITVPDGDIAEDSIVTATGNYTATAPNSGAPPWIMQMATFRQHP